MFKNSEFFTVEQEAPLLRLDNGFLEGQKDNTEAILSRVATWPKLIGVEDKVQSINWPEVQPDRIQVHDAERTFSGDENRKKLARFLALLASTFGDYHQGLSYTTSFLLLTVEEPEAFAILNKMNYDEFYVPGYWKHEAVGFSTDAHVFDKLMSQHFPDIHAHLVRSTIQPDTYVQKWFVGMCVHVLPFQPLFSFFEKFMQGGYRFLMRFGLALVEQMKDRLVKTTDPSQLFGLLRLDKNFLGPDVDPVALGFKILEESDKFDLSGVDFAALRKEMYETKLKARLEAAKKRAEESDEELSDFDSEEEDDGECEVCERATAVFHCKGCYQKLCESCSTKSKGGHSKDHKVVRLVEEDKDDEDDDDDADVDKLSKNVSDLKL